MLSIVSLLPFAKTTSTQGIGKLKLDCPLWLKSSGHDITDEDQWPQHVSELFRRLSRPLPTLLTSNEFA
jgi:hypothetical protein